MSDNSQGTFSNGLPTVATILGCPGELSSANGLVATPLAPLQTAQTVVPIAENADTTSIKDPIQKALVDNIIGKLPTKSSLEKFHCDLCDIDCMGEADFTSHVNGVRHSKRVKEEDLKRDNPSVPFIEQCRTSKSYHCSLCNANLNAFAQIIAHTMGTKHKSKEAARMKLDVSNSFINDSSGVRVDATPNLLFCATCNVHLNSTAQFTQHISSKRHINKVNGVSNRVVPYKKKPKNVNPECPAHGNQNHVPPACALHPS